MKKNSILSLLFALFFMQVAAQEDFNTSRIGVWPYGWGNAVAHHENLIYLSYGRTVQVYDHINPEEPQLLGEVFLDDMARAFTFEAGIAYVAGYNTFFILNISNPEQPEIISSLSIDKRANAIGLNNGYVYLALHGTGIGIIDISDIQNPLMVSVFETNQASYDLAISNNIAWIASGYQGLTAFDITDPLSPGLIFTYNESGDMRSVAINDSILFAANSASGLMAFNIASLSQVTLLSSTATIATGLGLDASDNLLVVSFSHHGFSLYNVSDPTAPENLGSFYAEWPNRKAVINGTHVFHTNSWDFIITEISDTGQINPQAQIELSGISQYVQHWDNHLFISSASSALIMAVDVTDPQLPEKVSQFASGDGHYAIHVKDNLMFFNNYHWLRIYDVSEPSEPVYLNTIQATTTITNVLKHNELLFISDYNNLQVFDISDIHAPELLGVYNYQGIEEMVAEGDFLYYVNYNYFVIVDISDPANLVQLSSRYNMSTTSLAVKDSLAYVVSKIFYTILEHSLKVFNIKDPNQITLVAAREPGREFNQVIVDGDYLYVFERYVGLNVFDIQGIQPVFCGFYNIYGFVSKMDVADGICYLPDVAGIDIVQNDLLTSAGGIFIERDERLKLFPNPAADMISFRLDDVKHTGMISYEIIQLNGSGIRSGKLHSGQQQISLDSLPAGVYVLHILQDGKKRKSGLFVKQ